MLTWLLRGFRKAIPLSLLREKALQFQTVPVKGSIRRTADGQVAVVHPHVAQRMVGPVTGTPEQAYQRSTHIVQTAQRLKRERDWGHPLLWEDHEHKGIVQDLAKEAGYQPDDSRWRSPDDFLADRLSLIGLHKVDRHLDGTPKLSPAGAVMPVGGENELKLAIWRAATVPDDESDELRKAIEQIGLFDQVVQVHGHVRQTDHGVTFVSPHLATRKKASPVLAGEPWEIPRTAFVSQPHKLSTFNDTKMSATYQATTPAGYVGFATWWKFDGLKGKTKAKEEAERDLRKRLSAIHLDRVKAALADGLAVPAEVMTDYPDLVKPKQTATEAFKKWFRDSKVVHPDGTPLVVYHATTSEFQAFRPGGLDPRVSGPAIWFRTDPTEIRSAHNTGYNQRSMREGTAEIPAYVSIQRPLIVDNDTRDWAQTIFGKEFPYFITEQNLAVLKKDGYDGVMLYSRDPRTRAKLQEVVAFDPTQVKSAIGNAGTFDPADPNLLKARVRAYTKKDGTFVREHMDSRQAKTPAELRGQQQTMALLEATGGDQVIPYPYASGMSHRRDMEATIESLAGLGVEINELSAPAIGRIVEAIVAGKPVFVDSGAFNAFKKALRENREPGAVDFERVFSRYNELSARIQEKVQDTLQRNLLMLVAPDVVGNQTATLDLIKEHAGQIARWIDAGHEVVVPFQRGPLRQYEVFLRVKELLEDRPFVVGIPSSAAAMSTEDLRELLSHSYQPDRLHILGAVSSQRFLDRMNVIRDRYVDDVPGVTSDANVMRSKLEQLRGLSGQPKFDKIKTILNTVVPDIYGESTMVYRVPPDSDMLTKGIHGGGHPLDYTTQFQGLLISIENQKGSIRRWTDQNGKTGQIKMTHPYGYIRRTQGVDGDHVDCFLGPNPDATHAYVIHSMAVPEFKQYDEDKVMLGFDSAEEAKQAFLDNYTDPRFFGSMHTIPMETFKKKALATKDKPAMIKSLSAADKADYEEESSEIRERAKKDGRRPHRFTAARWTYPNGHPRCAVCGEEERTDGQCPGKPAIRLQFAKAACSPGENCRWITVHPGGSGEGQPILIRESKTDKGTYHVIGGAGGKLNYLKLTNVKSEGEYKQQAAERAKKKQETEKERAKQDKEAGTFEPKRKALGDLKEQTQQHERALIEHVAETMGWTNYDLKPEQLQGLSDSAKGLIVAKHHRQLLRDAMDVVKQTRERLLDDADARVEAQLGELSIHRTEPDVLGLTDLMPPEKDAGKGYVPRYEEKAKAAGLDEEQLAKELDELKEQRKKELPPGMAEAGERLQAAMEQIRGEVKQAEASGKVATGERTTKPAPPTKAMALLSMAKQLQQVQAQSRKKAEAIKTGKDVVAKSYVIEAKPVTSSELIAELEADAQERERQDLCKSFLKTVETPLSIESEDEHADSLDRHIQVGATNALTRASLGLTGQDVLPHDVIAVLGTAGAAQALAHAMHSNLSPEDVKAFADRLATYHQAHHVEAAQEAIARAQELSEQAREIQLGTVDSPSELAVASEMNAKRVDMLREARELLGSTLGEMEAVAALEYALQAGPVSSIRVSLGAISNDTAVKQLRALGLAKEDYTVESDGKNRYGTVLSTGIPHLTRRIDPEEAKRYEFTRAVMNGEHDEEGWSPDGFARRPQSSYTDPNEQAVSFAQPFSVSSHGIIEEDLKSYIGSQMADGVPVANIYSSLLSHDLVNQVPEDQRQAYFEAIDRIAPLRDEAGKAVRAEAHTDGFKRMAEEFVTRKFGTDAAPLHAQQIDPTAKHTFEALHRVLADDPRRMVAFKKIGELTPQDQTLLRTHFEKTFAKPEQQAMVQEKLEALGPEPAKESDGLFGVQENPEWREWQTQRQGLLESASQAGLSWDKYVELHRGREGAYAAMQDHLKSGALQAFAEQYKKVSKTPLKIGRTVMRGNISHLDAVDPQAREARLNEQRQTVDQLRNRVEGKYAAGSIKDKLDRARELAAIADQNQVSMFLAHPEDPKNPTLKADERWTLGDTIEQQLTAVLPQVARNFSPNQPVSLIPDANMDGKYVNKQRLIKLIAANKRMVASLGTGSGKTSIGLGAFTHLHSQGKVKRGLFAVPSIVQRQFAGEGATWLEPGKYSWWANAGAPREERLAAYKDPSHHFAVVTHQALRDDMVHLMAKQAGIGEDEMAERFKGLNEGQRRATLTQTLQKEGINWDYLNIDEAHDALNRQGKPDSLFSNIIDAIGMETPYYVSASADPIKNDVSELFDQLHKVDPERYTDRGDFMAKYGINTTASRDALKRELMGRVFPGRVEPGVKAIKHDVPVALSAQQRTDYDAMMAAYRKARQARADGKVDVAALKQLSPSSFAGGDDEATGKRLNDALGTLRDTALSRVVNLAHPDHNAKIQEVMQRANQYREQGKPGLIFAHHREAVAQLTKQLKAQGHRVVTITGADSAKEKGRKQMLFHPPNGHDAEADIMVVSDAGAVGMNAQRGKWVIHYDIPHTAKTWWQRTGRIHRLGQKDDVDVVTLQTDSILDQKNKARLERKSGLREMLTSPYEGLEDSGIAASLLAPKEEKEPVAA